MQVGPDKDWRLIFAVFDENRSWYFNENLQKSSMSSPNTTDPEFYNSNVIYSQFTLELNFFTYILIMVISEKTSTLKHISDTSVTHQYDSEFASLSSRCEWYHVQWASVCDVSD